jgi:hypothetical protein
VIDLYVWKAPRTFDSDEAAAQLERWRDAGSDPARSPFELSTDVGWFYRELMGEMPGLDAWSDAAPKPSRTPVWLSTTDEPPARMVAIRLSGDTPPGVVDSIYGLATKYDLVLFDARRRRLHVPLEEMAAHASATFWPAGAVQAGVAGAVGGLVAIGAWLLGIPLVSGVVALGGGFMFVMAVYSFVHEGRKAVGKRRWSEGASPSDRDRRP